MNNNINQENIAIVVVGETVENLSTLYNYLRTFSNTFRKSLDSFIKYRNEESYMTLTFSEGEWLLTSRACLGPNTHEYNLMSIQKFLDLNIYNYNNKINSLTQSQKVNQNKSMVIYKTYDLVKLKRKITICITLQSDSIIHAGYAVLNPEDKFDDKLSKKISLGRALNKKTNLVEMLCGYGMDKKYILYSIADNLAKQIDNGKIVIKGIKETKKVNKKL